MSENRQPRVVVAGGGIAALEFVLALRDAAGDRVRISLIAPERELLLRPTLIAKPLADLAVRRPSLDAIAADVGFTRVPASVASVDADRHRVVLRGGGAVDYDTLVLAPGARRLPAFEGVIDLGDEPGTRALAALRADIGAGAVARVAFIAPTMTGWLLPLYEAALLTARLSDAVRVTLVTAEERPLRLFGEAASARVEQALRDAGVEFIGGCRPGVAGGAVVLNGGATLAADRIVSLPLMRGPQLPGVPETGLYALIPVDPFGRIDGLPDAYALGDATDFPIKQGGLAAQQADAAALHVAARHGAPVRPEPFRPALRASLLTGAGEPIALGDEEAPGKVPGRFLGRYLAAAAASVS